MRPKKTYILLEKNWKKSLKTQKQKSHDELCLHMQQGLLQNQKPMGSTCTTVHDHEGHTKKLSTQLFL
jgi:hypothetical protein